MGFGANVNKSEEDQNLLTKVLPEDLVRHGLIPEFIGRLPVITTLEYLSEEALVRILQEPKNALVKQYQKFFELENVELEFQDEALVAIAKEAIKRKIGARGLRSIIENMMLELMYDIPSRNDIEKVTITADAIEDRSKVIYKYRDQGEKLLEA